MSGSAMPRCRSTRFAAWHAAEAGKRGGSQNGRLIPRRLDQLIGAAVDDDGGRIDGVLTQLVLDTFRQLFEPGGGCGFAYLGRPFFRVCAAFKHGDAVIEMHR
jgi:hypothetical protein